MDASTKLRIRRRRHNIQRRRNPFLDGIASIFDFTGSLRTHRRSQLPPDVADQEALRSDWIAVGDAFRAVMGDWEDFEPTKDKTKHNGKKTHRG